MVSIGALMLVDQITVPAFADEKPKSTVRTADDGTVKLIADGKRGTGSGSRKGPRPRPASVQIPTGESPQQKYARQKRAWDDRVQAQARQDALELNRYSACLAASSVCSEPRLARNLDPLGPPPKAPDATPRPAGESLPPQVVAYTAIAQLQLTPPTPMIGPSPDINRWKMAAVGYPLWLWADGNLDPAPVSTTVYDLTVALDAHLDKVVFDMGDGHTVTCTNPTQKWHRGVTPGAASPTCGYRYTEPSLPKGKYTVTARSFWSVDWLVNGATGTIALAQAASTTLPVGELQVLIR